MGDEFAFVPVSVHLAFLFRLCLLCDEDANDNRDCVIWIILISTLNCDILIAAFVNFFWSHQQIIRVFLIAEKRESERHLSTGFHYLSVSVKAQCITGKSGAKCVHGHV